MCKQGRAERETETEAETETETESEGGSRLWAVSTEPDVGLELMTGAGVGCLTD